MLRKIELDALRADLAQVEALLQSRSYERDPIGYFQFQSRKKSIEEQIAKVLDAVETNANVGLFFGGKPVFGSRGISAEFAGRAIENFQDLVSKRFATLESGTPGQRGPVRLKALSDLMITDVVRGSFGLVLEEIAQNSSLTETAVKMAVEQVIDVVGAIASADEEVFESTFDSIDERQLVALRNFFRTLDEFGATVRLVESDDETSLDEAAVHRGRTRTEAIEIQETETTRLVGMLWLLPAHRKFELKLKDSGETIYGQVAVEFSKQHLEALRTNDDVVGKTWRTKMRIREIRGKNKESKFAYVLLGLVSQE